VTGLFLWQGWQGFDLSDEGFLWYGAQRVKTTNLPLPVPWPWLVHFGRLPDGKSNFVYQIYMSR
jgi:hypothetical protein